MAASKKQLEQFLASLEPDLAKSFLDSVATLKTRARLDRLEAAIASLDYEAAFYHAGIRDYAWTQLTEQVRSAYASSGIMTMTADIPARFGISFNISNPRATDWIAARSSFLVSDINEGQRRAIRAIITSGVSDGRGPRDIARDIAGRIDPRTGRRFGGVLGLQDQFADYSISARRELKNLDSHYFTRSRRDRRYDSLVQRSIEEGKPLTKSQIDSIVGRYEDRLLQTRAENVARTEALTAMNEASDESLRQVVDEGLVDRSGIKKVWQTAGDERTRPDHVAANGQEVDFEQPFIVGGYAMMHPGDSSLGAPAGQIINCRCISSHKIDFSMVRDGF